MAEYRNFDGTLRDEMSIGKRKKIKLKKDDDGRINALNYNGTYQEIAYSDVTKDPTGFENLTDSEISFNVSTLTFSIQPKSPSTSFNFYINGKRFTKSSLETKQITDVTATHFIYYNSSGVLTHSTTKWNILTDVPISYVYWNSDEQDGFEAEERHLTSMDGATHLYLHETRGTVVASGFAISGYELNPSVPLNSHNTFEIDSGIISDEDLRISIPTLLDGISYSTFYRYGINGYWYWQKQNLPFRYTIDGHINYNQLNVDTWQQTQLGNNEYVNMYVCATNSLDNDFKYIIFQGQNSYISLSDAKLENILTLQFGELPFQEIAPLYQITYRTRNNYDSTGRVRIENVTKLIGTGLSVSGVVSVGSHNALSDRDSDGSHPGIAISLNISSFEGNLDNTIIDTQKLAEAVDGLPQGTKLTSLKNSETLLVDSSSADIGIIEFDKETDTLMVFKNTVYVEESIEYNISLDGSSIEKIPSGTTPLETEWNEGTDFNFVVLKNVPADGDVGGSYWEEF